MDLQLSLMKKNIVNCVAAIGTGTSDPNLSAKQVAMLPSALYHFTLILRSIEALLEHPTASNQLELLQSMKLLFNAHKNFEFFLHSLHKGILILDTETCTGKFQKPGIFTGSCLTQVYKLYLEIELVPTGYVQPLYSKILIAENDPTECYGIEPNDLRTVLTAACCTSFSDVQLFSLLELDDCPQSTFDASPQLTRDDAFVIAPPSLETIPSCPILNSPASSHSYLLVSNCKIKNVDQATELGGTGKFIYSVASELLDNASTWNLNHTPTLIATIVSTLLGLIVLIGVLWCFCHHCNKPLPTTTEMYPMNVDSVDVQMRGISTNQSFGSGFLRRAYSAISKTYT